MTPPDEDKKEKKKEKEIKVCDMKIDTKKLLEHHTSTKKHKNNTDLGKNAEKCHIFICKLCDFKCSKESNYKLHLDTNKHKRLHGYTHKMPISESKIFICICGKKYIHRPSLAKHKRTCDTINSHDQVSMLVKCGSNNVTDDDKT